MGINYADKGEWKKFVEDYIVPLRESADILEGYWNYLREHIDNVPLEEIGKNEALKRILLGGMDEGGNYLDGSVAKFYNDFFGVSFSVKIPTGMVYSPPFHDFVTGIVNKTKEVMDSVKTKGISVVDVKRSEINYDEVLRNPEEVVRLIENFYNKCVKITPNYNEYTLFVLNVRAITERYFTVAFPWLLGKFDEVRELLGLKQDFEPPVDDRRKGHYVLWALDIGKPGYKVRELYEYIWEINRGLEDTLSLYFEGITDLKQEFLTSAKKSIESLSYEIVKSYDELPSIADSWREHELRVSKDGQIVDSFSPGLLKRDSNVFDFLDEISSLIFVGLVDIHTFRPSGTNYNRIDIKKIT
jgi:hypothetical protein